ncbi:DASH complex subunit DAM1 [Cryptococcus wingfieldii CBS 7118]|uniref:DASH complex subunit DAM1 n=1 Tax=Cryptococcus wingfieldii CBS 7118 TaxID=1295528 RepID=A0A1E3JJL1_9TREE|nr:DASH complex subunit DAM1 [Cryptococcus wingfieldii CBS 7118]ODO00826.1 DASH complex subunit DAM1 [Cryptococcus wingfieldii CBS 7118]
MPPSSNTPHHPLRRISTGSLSSLARSTDRANSSPSGLDFLLPALTDLSDEAATLATNTSQMTALHDALGTFNEAFAGYLYTLKMNAFCVEWPEPIAPPPSVSAMPPTPQSRPSQSNSHSETQASANAADMTYMTTHSDNSMEQTPPARPKSRVGAGAGAGVKKAPPGAAGKKPTGALKKKREVRRNLLHRPRITD